MQLSSSESAVRRRAAARGYRVEKSRQQEHSNNQGLFQLIREDRNEIVLGVNYDASLDEIAQVLSGESPERIHKWPR